MVDVGLVPGLEAVVALGDRVLAVDDLRPERAGAVAEELAAHEADVLLAVPEAERGAVDGHQGASPADPLQQGRGPLAPPAVRAEQVVVRIDHERVRRLQGSGL